MAWHHWCKCATCDGYRPVDGHPDRPLPVKCPPEVYGEKPPGKLCDCKPGEEKSPVEHPPRS